MWFFQALCGLLILSLGALWLRYREVEQKRRALETSHRQLKRKMRRFGEISSEVAHEIKNPLTSILCSAETLDLLIGNDIADEHRRSLKYIKDYGENMLRLVSSFLDLSRAESGLLKIEISQIPVSELLDSVSGLLFSNAIRQGIELVSEVEDEGLILQADQRHCKQVLFNLIHNAIKFTPQGGTVRISARRLLDRDEVEIAVRDSGVGIASERLVALFESKESFGLSDDGFEVGVGLGLALSKKLLELNGGSIEVDSNPGEGSCFRFYLKAGKGEVKPKGAASMAIESPNPLGGREFLLVGQRANTADSVCSLLMAWGGAVRSVEGADEALELLKESHFDLVIVDDSSLDLSPLEFSKLFRSLPNHHSTPLLVSLRKAEDRIALLEAGVDQCLEKPFNGKRLLQSLINTGQMH